MSVTSVPATVGEGAATPAATRRPSHLLLRAALVAGALVVILMWWSVPTAVHGVPAQVTAAGRLAGLLGAYLVLLQLLLMARVPWFEQAVGFDRLAAWHRGLGTNTVVLLCAHVLLVVEGYSLTDHHAVTSTAWRVVSTYPDMLKALLGLGLFLAVAVTSARSARRRLSYETWYAVHLTSYAAVALAFGHQLASGQDFIGHRLNQLLWYAMYAVVAASIAWWRLLLPARAWFRHRLLVERVVLEGPGVVSVWVRGRHLDELGARAGQFMLWRFLAPGHLWSAHPYSLSVAPDNHRLRITVKDSGDHSADLAHIRPGTPVLAEGPFGHFTLDRSTRSRVLLVAGGAGIGPIRALAEELTGAPSRHRDVVLLYRVSHEADLVLRHELEELARRRGIRVHYLVGRRKELRVDPLSVRALHRYVPDARDRDVFVCGPPGMTHMVLKAMRELHVPARQLHSEEFELI